MTWKFEWIEANPITEEKEKNEVYETEWKDVTDRFCELLTNDLCEGITVYCLVDGHPWPTNNPIVLQYCP